MVDLIGRRRKHEQNPHQDANSKWVFTTDEGRRGGKTLHLKSIVDKAVEGADCVEKVFVFTATGAEVCMTCHVKSCHVMFAALEWCRCHVMSCQTPWNSLDVVMFHVRCLRS